MIRLPSLIFVAVFAVANASTGGPAYSVSAGATPAPLTAASDRTAPTVPVITSSTNPRSGWWYNTRVERFTWTSTDAQSGIAGYSYRIDRRMDGKPGPLLQQNSATFRGLADGKWVLHVWARDRAGNWSGQAIFKLNLDTTPPGIRFLGASAHIFNPYLTTETWRFSVDQWSRVTIDIRRSGQSGPLLIRDLGRLRPGERTFTWNGKTAGGQLSPADWHWFHVTATDGVGNSSNLAFGGIHVRPIIIVVKRIVISLSQQSLVAYENGRPVWSSLVTTGNRALTPTPAGHYSVFARYSPYQFVSPWPPGHPYWYESAWSTYAMEFIAGGYFIHDAPWRSVFGPASQGGGTPGTDYGGTHGCVNVPFSTSQFLWTWAPIGTPVDIVP